MTERRPSFEEVVSALVRCSGAYFRLETMTEILIREGEAGGGPVLGTGDAPAEWDKTVAAAQAALDAFAGLVRRRYLTGKEKKR